MSRLASALLLAAFATGALFAQEEQVLNLEGMSVIGNRELPKSLVIVPWKKALPGEVSAPVESLLDEALAPIDRDVFRRQLNYYHAGQFAGE